MFKTRINFLTYVPEVEELGCWTNANFVRPLQTCRWSRYAKEHDCYIFWAKASARCRNLRMFARASWVLLIWLRPQSAAARLPERSRKHGTRCCLLLTETKGKRSRKLEESAEATGYLCSLHLFAIPFLLGIFILDWRMNLKERDLRDRQRAQLDAS